MMNKRTLLLSIRIGLALLLLLALFLLGWLDFDVFSRITLKSLMAPLPFYILAFLAGIYRWRCLVRAAKIPISLWDITRLTMTGIWVSSVIPGGSILAGDVARTALFAVESSSRRTTALISVFLDRLVGMLAIFLIAVAALLLNISMLAENPWLQMIGLVLISLITLFLVIALTALSSKAYDFLTSSQVLRRIPGYKLFLKFLDAFHLFQNSHSAIIKAHLASYFGHGSMIFAILILAKQIGIQLNSPSEYVFAISIGIVSAMIPVSGPAGLGTGNVGFAASFALLGSNDGAALALLWQATLVLACQSGLPFFLMGRRTSTLLPHKNSTGVKKGVPDKTSAAQMERIVK